jgi:hypothetical protein
MDLFINIRLNKHNLPILHLIYIQAEFIAKETL